MVDEPARTAVVVAAAAERCRCWGARIARRAYAANWAARPGGFVNGLFPPSPPAVADAPAGRLWHDRRAVQERELVRLAAAWQGPKVELPLLPLDSGPVLVRELATRLANTPAGEAA